MTLAAGSGRSWAGFAAALAIAAVAGWWWPPARLDWQPQLATIEPWRAFSAAFVHWSARHLAANLLGAAVVGSLGAAARVPARLTWAWVAAWPLTQIGLLLRPELAHYGGLSGVLHAGTAACATWLVLEQRGRQRLIGCAIAAGLMLKVGLEDPWGPPLRVDAGWGIAVAPLAHATGTVAGALCAALACAARRCTT